MSIEEVIRCDDCKCILENDGNGFAIVGNINVTDVTNPRGIGGGIIGNNFPVPETGDGRFEYMEVKVNHYCFHCLRNILEEA